MRYAYPSQLRASYSIVDHRERQIAPHCLSFNINATKYFSPVLVCSIPDSANLAFCRIYCGYEDAIEVFDVQRPGNDEGTRLHTTPSKKTKDGLKGEKHLPRTLTTISLLIHSTGIISSLAFCPDQTNEYFAAGTLAPSNFNIALFSESTGEKTLMWVGREELRSSVSQVISESIPPFITFPKKSAEVARNTSLGSTQLTRRYFTRPSAGVQRFTAGIFAGIPQPLSKSSKLLALTLERSRIKSLCSTSTVQEGGWEWEIMSVQGHSRAHTTQCSQTVLERRRAPLRCVERSPHGSTRGIIIAYTKVCRTQRWD